MPSLPSSLEPIEGLPDYGYDPLEDQYYNVDTGAIIGWQTIRRLVDGLVTKSEESVEAVSEKLRKGAVVLSEWQTEMMTSVKTAHISAAVLAIGGFSQMTQSLYNLIGRVVNDEYKLLRNFALQIQDGKQKLDGTLTRRAKQYLSQLRPMYYRVIRFLFRQRGFDEERSILTPADHCTNEDGNRGGCVEEARKGWQPIGEMIRIGDRNCYSNCRCKVQYRNTQTGKVIEK